MSNNLLMNACCDLSTLPRRARVLVVLATVVSALLWTDVRESKAADLEIHEHEGVVTVEHNGQLLLEYQAMPHPYKVYVSRWFTPKGLQILRDSPHDHVHHHALMYAIGVDKVDFWAEFGPDKDGKQIPSAIENVAEIHDGKGHATINQRIDWVAPDGKTLVNETRAVSVLVGQVPNVSLLTWKMTMVPPKERKQAELWGRHYFGLGMRFVTSMDGVGTFIFSSEQPAIAVRGTEKLVHADWAAYTASVDGKPVTVAMFDDPANPRHPATWFTMTKPFAYLTATLNLKKEPMTITRTKPLNARYGAALWDGKVDRKTIQQVYDKWIEQ